ncbi:unnamed protein product [Lasius platythorax]|uniref:Uncharacterized protein n=1 Tax=Lasius platythorax TaxID=488582 RepID=A0AAV2P700_9HYME
MASYEQEETSTKTKLLTLQCPFNWEILDSIIKHTIMRFNSNNTDKNDTIDDEASCPLELLMKFLFKCYKAVLSADDDEGREMIAKAEDVLMQIQQGQELCQTIRAIEHVFYATKCFVLYDAEEINQLEEILENIIDTDDFSNEELGTLYGCQSVVWSCLNDFGMNKAVEIARKAVEKNQDCALWHFILGKNLRRQRRSINVSSEVSDAEREHFEIAYAMSKNQVFGIYYLQMRMESFYKFSRVRDYMMRKTANEKQVLHIAKEILKTKPTNYKVLLKLALMFLRAKVSDERLLAKECLDAVEQIAPSNSTYLHYTAMFYEQCGDYREAIKYFKKASECNNFVAELSYIQYGWETGELEPLPHLLRMLKKYEHLIKERQIAMLLGIAITYYSLHKDITNAAEYFLKALMIDPGNNKFKIYYKFLDFDTPNILFFLNNQFCPLLESKNSREISQKIKNLLNVKDVADLAKKLENLSTTDKTE